MRAEPVPEDLRKQASSNPSSWLHVVDPAYSGLAKDTPPSAIVGAYWVDENGEIDPDFVPNPGHGRTTVDNPLEDALWRSVCGADNEIEVLRLLDFVELLVVASPDGQHLHVYQEGDTEYIVVFTSAHFVPEGIPATLPITLDELRPALADRHLAINPASPLSVSVPGLAVTDLLPGGAPGDEL